MVSVSDGCDPLLKRPFAIFRSGRGWIELLVKVRGRGTALVSELGRGKSVEIIGPLGKCHPMPGKRGDVFVVAGGIGIASVMSLMEVLGAGRLELFFGIKCEEDMGLLDFARPFRRNAVFTSDDGCAGKKGLVTGALIERLDRGVRAGSVIYACGPTGMLREVASIAAGRGLRCLVSLEERMACGIGACLGCAVRAKGGGVRHVCVDGPAFESSEVEF
jgi:dihydroorotate dehydrogenase electron transfer subunit